MPLQRKTIVENLKINYGLMEKKWILVCQKLVDSSAVEGFGVEAKSVYDKRSRRNY
jgi:hypothetical protein